MSMPQNLCLMKLMLVSKRSLRKMNFGKKQFTNFATYLDTYIFFQMEECFGNLTSQMAALYLQKNIGDVNAIAGVWTKDIILEQLLSYYKKVPHLKNYKSPQNYTISWLIMTQLKMF